MHFQVRSEVIRIHLRFTQRAVHFPLCAPLLFLRFPPLMHDLHPRPSLRLRLLPMFLHMLQPLFNSIKSHVAVAAGHRDIWPQFRQRSAVGLEVRIQVVIVSHEVSAYGTCELFDVLMDGFDVAAAAHVCSEGLGAVQVGTREGLLAEHYRESG